jgi:MSHA pilin protein MshD
MLLIGVTLAASMAVVSSSVKSQYKAAERATGQWLADGMMADISQLPYQDPTLTTTACGIETGESSTSKANYDDVDDFNGWTESPPQDKTGTALSSYTGWRRSVAVVWVSPTALTATTASSTETGCKRITITVSHNSVVVATRVGIRTNHP